MTMTDQKLKVGQTLEFEVPISGEPEPEVSWSLNGAKIMPSKRVTIESVEGKARIVVKPVEVDDAGAYTLTLTNSSGADTHTVDVIIRGKRETIIV